VASVALILWLGKENIEGFMPENPGNNICPVSTYIKYVSKLNKNCNRLRQRSKDSFHDDDEVWFCNVPVGKQTLAGFISGLSKKMNLSKSYPSHRIRATEATLQCPFELCKITLLVCQY
jgi:hypothetical protein